MKAIIHHYELDEKGNHKYGEDKKPIITSTEIDFPISFGYGSYNKPRKILGSYTIQVDNILSIDIESA